MKKFLSYGRQLIGRDDIRAVTSALKSDFLTQGPEVAKFENEICNYTGAKYCVVVSSATAGLHIAVAALEIKPESEGITSPNTFVASANCLVYNSIKPVFADIDESTYNISVTEIQKRTTKKTKVIVTVDYAGQVCEAKKISRLAKDKGIYIIEDAAHAIGSKYKDGSRVGSCRYSDMTVFSFHPIKNMTTGEGGAITTNNKIFYERLLMLRSHGVTKDQNLLTKNPGPWYYEMQLLGFNYRISDICAALGRSQLKKLDKFVSRRRVIVGKYNKAFEKIENIATPYEQPGVLSAFHLYTLQLDFKKIGKTRTEVMEELRSFGVGSQVLYIPVSTQPFYKRLGYKKGDYPIAEAYYEQALSIPLHPGMKNSDVKRVVAALIEVVSSGSSRR